MKNMRFTVAPLIIFLALMLASAAQASPVIEGDASLSNPLPPGLQVQKDNRIDNAREITDVRLPRALQRDYDKTASASMSASSLDKYFRLINFLLNQAKKEARNRIFDSVVKNAKAENRKKVSENRGDNVPRYRNGKGRVAPYSVGDEWCVAFVTAMWSKSGYRKYLEAPHIWRTHAGHLVAVQVKGITDWAKSRGMFFQRALPGFMIVYKNDHVGIVEKVNSRRVAVRAIDGNHKNSVSVRRVNHSKDVLGYIPPV